jgi:hypothetical protein
MVLGNMAATSKNRNFHCLAAEHIKRSPDSGIPQCSARVAAVSVPSGHVYTISAAFDLDANALLPVLKLAMGRRISSKALVALAVDVGGTIAALSSYWHRPKNPDETDADEKPSNLFRRPSFGYRSRITRKLAHELAACQEKIVSLCSITALAAEYQTGLANRYTPVTHQSSPT